VFAQHQHPFVDLVALPRPFQSAALVLKPGALPVQFGPFALEFHALLAQGRFQFALDGLPLGSTSASCC
jgi:hypothetical protein